MRLSEGSFTGAPRRISVVAYLLRESSVRGCNSHFARQRWKEKELAASRWRRRLRGGAKLLLDDPDFYLRVDVGVQPNQDAVDSQRSDRLVELDLAPLDLKPLRFELVRDIG
jgi:hypothetical protein